MIGQHLLSIEYNYLLLFMDIVGRNPYYSHRPLMVILVYKVEWDKVLNVKMCIRTGDQNQAPFYNKAKVCRNPLVSCVVDNHVMCCVVSYVKEDYNRQGKVRYPDIFYMDTVMVYALMLHFFIWTPVVQLVIK